MIKDLLQKAMDEGVQLDASVFEVGGAGGHGHNISDILDKLVIVLISLLGSSVILSWWVFLPILFWSRNLSTEMSDSGPTQKHLSDSWGYLHVMA